MKAQRRIRLAWLVAAAAVLPATAQEADRDLIWGVNGHPLVSYPGVTFEQQLDYVKDLGMTSYRVDVVRAEQAPGLAKLVQAAKVRGIDILPVLVPGLNLDKETTEALYDKAYAFAVSLVSRFKNDIRVWELGNELENYAIIRACEMQDDGAQYNCKWGPAGGVGSLEYYAPRWAKVSAVLKGLSDGTTAVDPTIRKAMGTAGWGHTGAFARMQQDGIRWDISVWHMYGQDPEWAFKILARFNHPIWVTEFNHPGGSHRSGHEQADGIVRAMTRLRQLRKAYNIEAAHIYELMDETYWAPSLEAFMGLVSLVKDDKGRWRPGERNPAYAAAKLAIASAGAWAPRSADCHLNPHNRLSSTAAMQVSYIYCLVLERPVDGAGLKDRMAALSKGTSVTQLLRALLGSVEFSSKHSASNLSNSDFVSRLYRVLLKREPDGAGHSTYVASLDKGSSTRAGVTAAMIESAEFRAQHPILFPTANDRDQRQAAPAAVAGDQAFRRDCDLKRYNASDFRPENRAAYGVCLVLGRRADGSGLQSWSESLSKGETTLEMIGAMLRSDEFRTAHNATSLSHVDFVTLLYRILLGRNPDPRGLADYVAQLEAGSLSRSGLPKSIISSSEFASKHPLLVQTATPEPAKPPRPN